jgi:serine/threonine-protein kinase PknG
VGADRSVSPEVLPEQDRWRVRVCDADGAVLGAGLLLGTRHVLTCAHVLRPDDPGTEDPPNVSVIIDFVGLPRVLSAKARITVGGWVPLNDIKGGDIALLELEAPQSSGSITPLRRLPTTRHRAVFTCGFPRGLEDGMWVDATLAGDCGPNRERVQMNAISAGRQVRAGFSGAPVFDDATGYVIGMVVSKYNDEEAGISHMLPVETIIRHLPRVKEWVSGAKASDPSLIEELAAQRLDDDLARKVVSWIERHRDTDNIQIIITGNSDSPESATVRRAIRLADREQRPDSVDPQVAQAPEGTVPPPGGIDLAVDATGKTPAEVFRRIADRVGMPVDQSTERPAQLSDSLPPMTMIINGIDDAVQPEALLTEVIEPLAKRGHRLLLTFSRELSPSLTTARSLINSAPPDPDSIESWPDGSRPVAKEWMCAGLVPLPVVNFPDPVTRIVADPGALEQGQICGKNGCTATIGRTRAGEPAYNEGLCPRCGAPFSFVPALSEGDLVADQYKVIGCLARGGQGLVYLAKDTNLDRYVALKGLINTNDEWALAMAASERSFLTTLDHPNIVRIFNFVTHPHPHSGKPIDYIVMEYVDGLPMDEVKKIAAKCQNPLGGPLLVEHIIAYGIEILDAFDYLHRHGLLYCDMKPSNVIRSANRIKIIDLGAARRADDRTFPIVQTPEFGVSRAEIEKLNLTVRSDIHTVGKTLENLFSASADVLNSVAELDSSRVLFGIESFLRALERATHEQANSRFPSAAAMSQQLRGILREVLSLRDGDPRPEPSTVFAGTAALLDAGLGMVPSLDSWTASRAAGRATALIDGRPSAAAVAVGLPAPQVDPEDPAADFLAKVSATDPRRLIGKLLTFDQKSVEIHLFECRTRLEIAEFENARDCLGKAKDILGSAANYDWRITWHHGLLALANDQIDDAQYQFAEVYHALPGEDAPKLALGFCYESLGKPDEAESYYRAVWCRDRLQPSAVFGLARIHLYRGNRKEAITILDEVPDVSRHYDAARIAAVRILSGRLADGPGNGLPTAADFDAAVSRLAALNLDEGAQRGASRDRLTAAVREGALAWVRETEGDEQLNGDNVFGRHVDDVLGKPVRERELRELLEKSFRALARQATNLTDHHVLIDLANAVRRSTPW